VTCLEDKKFWMYIVSPDIYNVENKILTTFSYVEAIEMMDV